MPRPQRTIRTSSYLIGSLGGGLRGYELGIVAGAILFITPALHLSPAMKGVVVSSALFGSLIGALAVGPIADRIGRRKVIALSAILYAVSALGAAFSPTAVVLIVSRVVLGLAVGASTSTVPVYIAEIAPARRRGAFGGLFQVIVTSGVVTASLVALALRPYGAWRWMFGLGAIPALVMLIGVHFLPDSPRWLVTHGRETEARDALARTREQVSLDEEIAAIKSVDQQERQRVRLGTALRSSRLKRLLLIGLGLALFKQLMGTDSVNYYGPSILTGIGFTKTSALAFNVGLSLLGLAVTIVTALFIIDRVGRRKPLIVGALGMALSMLVLGITSHGGHVSGSSGYVAVGALALFKVSFTASWGGITFVVWGEIFPLNIRATANGMTTFVTEAVSVIISLVFPVFRAVGSGAVFFTFAGMGVLASLLVTLFLPETRHRSLEDIEADLTLGTKKPRAGGRSAAVAKPRV